MAEQLIQRYLDEYEVAQNESLGQHFLIDDKVIDTIVDEVHEGSFVVEVGAGIGHVSTRLAERASHVLGIEIDRRYQPILEDLQEENHKLTFVMGDALKVPLQRLAESAVEKGEKVQVIANLPFHITEPFLRRMVDLPISNATLMLGDKAGEELSADESSPIYGRMSLVAQTFYDVRQLAKVPKESFSPPPRTESVLVGFDPKERKELKSQPYTFVLAELIRREQKYGLVVNDLKQALVDATMNGNGSTLSKADSHRRDRSNTRQQLKQMVQDYNLTGEVAARQRRGGDKKVISQADALDVIAKMDIPCDILNKPFFRLNNNELRALVRGIKGYYFKD